MYGRSQFAILLAAAYCAAAAPPQSVLGVAEAGKPFLIGLVETKPEAGPLPLVDGDQVKSMTSPVSFRLEGENRAVLGANSIAGARRFREEGVYFYLAKGSIRFDARKQPLAICAADRLYVPSIPASGEVAVENNRVQVRMTAGTMFRSGVDPCGEKALPVMLTNAAGATTGAGTAATTGAVTATATAAGVGAGTSAAAITAVAVGAGTAAGVAATIVVSQPPPPESPINPAQ